MVVRFGSRRFYVGIDVTFVGVGAVFACGIQFLLSLLSYNDPGSVSATDTISFLVPIYNAVSASERQHCN